MEGATAGGGEGAVGKQRGFPLGDEFEGGLKVDVEECELGAHEKSRGREELDVEDVGFQGPELKTGRSLGLL